MSLGWSFFCWILSTWTNPGTPAIPQATPASRQEGIRTSDKFSVGTLVQDIFVGGACKNVSNISAIGNTKGIGYFEQGSNSIGIERGIILATGPIGNAEGPNAKGDLGGDFKDASGDPDLRNLTSAPIFDAVGLEFNFVPLDSLVTFRYVFASEEYCEFVGSNYNDVFGFFVSGPGINGPFTKNSQNVALVPGGTEYVSINNINHLKNTPYFVRNEPQKDADRCQIDWQQPPNFNRIEFDGFTKVMTATLKLIPCQTYTLRLVIADASDGNYDSAVFLEAESFNIGGNINLATGSVNGKDTLLEGCNTGYFIARRRPGEKTDLPLSIGLRVGSNSQAKPGIDFQPLPKTITIPAGATEIPVPVQVYIDDEQEPVESIMLELDFPCSCISDTAKLYIQDPPLLRTGLQNRQICVGETIRIEARPQGGVPPYSFAWSARDTASYLTISPKSDTTISLSLTDSCGRTITEQYRITRRPPPVLFIQSKRDVCQGDTVHIPIYFNGEAPFSFVYTNSSGKKDTLRQITTNPFYLPVSEAGILHLSQFKDALCEGQIKGSAEVRHYSIKTIVRAKDLSCLGIQDGQIQVEASGGVAPYKFDWKNTGWNTPLIQRLPAGIYELQITDINNCSAELSVLIKEPPLLEPVTFDCRDLRGSFLILSAKGGVSPYSYSIDGKHFEDQSLFDKLSPGETFTLFTRDANGCTISQSFLMPARYDRMVTLPPSVKLDLGQKYLIETQLNIPPSLVGNLEWSPAAHLNCTDCLRPTLSALENETILLKVTDVFGCTDGASIIIKLNRLAAIFMPNAFSPNGDGNNDRFSIFADPRQIIRIHSLEIFNRWGQLVFYQKDMPINAENYGWDGTFKGKIQEPGMYIFKASLELSDGNLLFREGSFSLMR